MKKSLWLTVSVLFIVYTNVYCSNLNNINDSLTIKIDALLKRYDSRFKPGLTIGIIDNGKLVFEKGYGSANIEAQLTNSPSIVYEVASVSKQFTAAATLNLIQEQKLSFDDEIHKFIPEIPDYGHPITISDLLYHTSGIRDYMVLMWLCGIGFEEAFSNDDALASAFEFAKEGAKVVIADISDAGKEISDKLTTDGFSSIFVKTDVSNEQAIINLIEKTVEEFGKLDVMFANAGINIEATVEDLKVDDWQKVIDINLKSVYLSNKYAIAQFKKQGSGGAIVNSGSIHSLVAREGLAPYSASKGGVKMLTQQVAAEVSKHGIRANAIAPGYIKTELINTLSQDVIDSLVSLHPMGRLGEPVEVAKTVLFLASDDASFISGVTLPIDGGYTAV